MYKLQSEGAFTNPFRLGYDNMQLKPDYHDRHRHFSLIDNLGMNELNNRKTFDYVKSYTERPTVATSYQTVRKDMPPVPAEKVEAEQPREPAKSRKRKRHRKRNRRNRNRKNKSREDPAPSLVAQFCAISIGAPDEVDGCFTVRPNSLVCRPRLPSDCDSEDSFIVFGNENVATPFYPECRPRFLSECISEDSFIVFDGQSECGDSVVFDFSQDSDELPAKKVRFASEENLCEIHPMVQWSYAYQKARKGPWEQFALDRMRFRHRVANVQPILDRILEPSHRSKIYKERFSDGDS